jgi:hypothetical protein
MRNSSVFILRSGQACLAAAWLALALTLFLTAAVEAAPVLKFDDPTAPGGTVSWAGPGSGIVGTDIQFQSILGIDTPENAGGVPLLCNACQMDFVTGLASAQFTPDGAIVITGSSVATSVTLTGGVPDLGIPDGSTLMTGVFTGTPQEGIGPGRDFGLFIGSGDATFVHPALVDHFGLGGLDFQFATSDIQTIVALNEITGAFTGTVFNADLNLTVPVAAVLVDKQVSCNGAAFVDAMLVAANNDGTNGCSALDGQPIAVQYQVQNTGEGTAFQCVLTVVQQDGTPSSFSPAPIPVGNIPPGQTTPLIVAVNSPQNCSDDLEAEEPDTATVTCCTVDPSQQDPPGCPDGFGISAFDTATFTCVKPILNVAKVCVDANSDGIAEITVTADAVGSEANLVNCAATDLLFRDDPTCPADVGVGTLVALTPANPFTIDAGGQQVLTGFTPPPPLSADACNTVSVTCTIEGTNTTITDSANAVCPGVGQGCLHRTPGFWGNHPGITSLFLPLGVCGVELDTVAANSVTSATEAICSVGNDGQILGPQLTQLVRQCTAALLNVAASASGGGNCPGDFPPLAGLLTGCCGAESVCTGDPVAGLTIQSCIDQLDAFNNSPDTLPPFDPFVSPGPADPSLCQASRNNGVVVTPAQ